MKEKLKLESRNVGEIRNGVYVTFRDDSHFFAKFDGFGCSMSVLDSLFEKGIEIILVNYKNLILYQVDINEFIIHGEEYDDKGDKQLILAMRYWKMYSEKKEESHKHCPVCQSSKYNYNFDEQQYDCLKCGFINQTEPHIVSDEGGFDKSKEVQHDN